MADEQELLAQYFDRVFLIPCEVFSNEQKAVQRPIPENFEILDINTLVAKGTHQKRHAWSEWFSVMWYEFVRCSDKIWFLRELWRYRSVLKHQQASADVIAATLRELGDAETFFYAYWVHNSAVILGLLKRRNVISRYICRAHSIDLYDRDWALVKTQGTKVLPFHHFNMEQADAVWSISEHGTKHLQQKFPQRAAHFATHRLGVDDLGDNPFRATGPFVLVTCSQISRSKGVHRMIELLSRIDLPVRWVHFGAGGDRENEVREAIKNLPKNIEVELRGFTPNDQIKSFYASAPVHLFLSLSEAEGIPVSLMEAISFGIPVLATDVYGSPEVANEVSGFTIPYTFDANEVATLIRNFLSDELAQKQKREGAKKLFHEKFNGKKNHRKFIGDLLMYGNDL